MQDQERNNQPAIVTGMHRSGTSLAASILQSLGIHVGDRLLGAGVGNPKGHFEDVDFLTLHQGILVSQGVNSAGWTTSSQIAVPQQFTAKAKFLRDERMARGEMWGWKDPRTSLFLPFWSDLIPEAKYIFVYREPWDVIDSLFRRNLPADEIFHDAPKLAIDTWVTYNTAILNFYQENHANSVLVHIDHFKGIAAEFTRTLREKLKLAVSELQQELFNQVLMHSEPLLDQRIVVLSQFYPEAIALFNQLNAQADLPCQRDPLDAKELASSYKDWALRDWLTRQKAVRQNQLSQAELQDIRLRLQQSQTDLQGVQLQLQQKQSQLQQSQTQLQQTRQELQQAQTQLQQVRAELEASQALVEDIKSSRFWKANQLWGYIKSLIRVNIT